MTQLKKIIKLIYLSNYWIYLYFITSFKLLWINPMFLIFWLILCTAGLKLVNVLNWEKLIKTWTPILSVWYLILLTSLISYSPVVVGPGYTEELFKKILQDEIFFERICFSTIFFTYY